MSSFLFAALFLLIPRTVSPSPTHSLLQPLPKGFKEGNSSVVYVKDRLTLLPSGFSHTKDDQPFFDLSVPNAAIESDLAKISKADFIAFDERFFEIIGSKPSLEGMFDLGPSLREAPVYIPEQNKLFLSDQGAGKQILVDLNVEPPTFKYLTLTPPIEALNGAMYSPYDGLIYATVNACPSAESGIYAIDPNTWHSKPVVNNFIGHHFNSPNDLALTDDGIWFTDPPYAAILGNASSAELRATVYFYNTTSKLLRPVEEDIQMPNGVATSVDNKMLYIADSGALCKPIGQPTVPTKHHSVYEYDIIGSGKIANRRLFYISDHWVPDGIKTTRAGNLYSAAGIFVDVVSSDGDLLGKLRFPGIVANIAFAGTEYNQLWIVGLSGIYRAKINEHGPRLGTSSECNIPSSKIKLQDNPGELFERIGNM